MRQSAECTLNGKIDEEFFNCDRHLLRGVTLRFSFKRAIDDFVIMSDYDAKQYKVKFSKIFCM